MKRNKRIFTNIFIITLLINYLIMYGIYQVFYLAKSAFLIFIMFQAYAIFVTFKWMIEEWKR